MEDGRWLQALLRNLANSPKDVILRPATLHPSIGNHLQAEGS